MELMIGCGSRKQRMLSINGKTDFDHLITLDINPDHSPDVLWDLNIIPLPFDDDTFDEIHAIEVMEHIGSQGDWKFFFSQWSDFWRILKPGGVFVGTSPHWSSPWAWMDPGHTRAFGPEMMGFLIQTHYSGQVGATPMTDYRFVYKADFDLVHSVVTDEKQYQYALRAVKPSRITA